MMSLYEQSKWRFGADIKGFRLVDEAELPYEEGRPLDCPEDHPAHDKAKGFIIELAEMYKLGTINIEDINIEKKRYKEFAKNNAVFKPHRDNKRVQKPLDAGAGNQQLTPKPKSLPAKKKEPQPEETVPAAAALTPTALAVETQVDDPIGSQAVRNVLDAPKAAKAHPKKRSGKTSEKAAKVCKTTTTLLAVETQVFDDKIGSQAVHNVPAANRLPAMGSSKMSSWHM